MFNNKLKNFNKYLFFKNFIFIFSIKSNDFLSEPIYHKIILKKDHENDTIFKFL